MVVTILLLFIGLLFSGYAFQLLLRRRRVFAAGVNGLIGLPLVMTGGFFSMLLLNLQTYQQLTKEVVLADVYIGQSTAQGFPVRLSYADKTDTYLIQATEWRLDAHFVKWKPWMSLFGKEPIVRLERLEERAISNGGAPVMKSYDLTTQMKWADEFISVVTNEIGLIDTVYGSSVYMPAIPGAEYQVTASISGLVARPMNQSARRAVLEWSQP
jgi:hypothetical protein